MQDFTGVPAVVDLATMREGIVALGGDPEKINPLTPVDLVIDHSLSVESFGTSSAFEENVKREYEQNQERYRFLKWGQQNFKNFRVVPPGTGICHQVNLEYLAKVVWSQEKESASGEFIAYPDTLVGTDSHTTMANGLSVLGWGVGGIEAEAAMLGQSLGMVIPEVVGLRFVGELKEGITSTDLVLHVVQILRKQGVVQKFVEFFGPGLRALSLADRATLANMAPEYGATCGFFPIDNSTLEYLKLTGRSEETLALVEAYAKAQYLWGEEKNSQEIRYSSVVEVDLGTVRPCLAGPARPQDKVFLEDVSTLFKEEKKSPVLQKNYSLDHGHVVLAAITSCTNTSNPSVLIGAGLLAKKAVEQGLCVAPWVKTSLAPGSQVVTDYLNSAGLTPYLDKLGFNLVGYGCTTCIGNSGPLSKEISQSIQENGLTVGAVLSGNRNFEGRINPDIKANFLASPPLVVAYALAGTLKIDLSKDPLGQGKNGPVYLKDIWPSNSEIESYLKKYLSGELFSKRYANVFKGDKYWSNITAPEGKLFSWDSKSTYIRNPEYFKGLSKDSTLTQKERTFSLEKARILALLGDSITTDHISPAGKISPKGPAGKYLKSFGVEEKDFNSYGGRRGNHEVMMRGTFANIRLKNEMLQGVEGGETRHVLLNTQMSIFDASISYQEQKIPLVIFAGKEYGTGSSRDWAAKGTMLLGVKAVIAESFERIHRSNLIGMGVLPLIFTEGTTRKSLNLTGSEIISLSPVKGLFPKASFLLEIEFSSGEKKKATVIAAVETMDECSYLANGGILPFVLRQMI